MKFDIRGVKSLGRRAQLVSYYRKWIILFFFFFANTVFHIQTTCMVVTGVN